jgi:hypothetical protein
VPLQAAAAVPAAAAVLRQPAGAVVQAAAADSEPLEEAVASGAPVRQPAEAGPAALDVAVELLQVAAEA